MNFKIRGSNDYIKDYKLKIPNDKLFWEEPMFIGNVYNEKINFEPYLLDIELFSNSKINDLIMDGGPVATKLVMSSKLKSILERFRKTDIQFFSINVLRKNEVYNNYWILNMYGCNEEYIDYENSKVILRKKKKEGGTHLILIDVKDICNFEIEIDKAQVNLESLYIENLALKNVEEDFFMFRYVEGGVGYFVSEKLKKEIEEAGCTGIEFQPSELSYDEWLAQDGPREKIYGKI